MSGLDFSALTDDQLLQLMREAMREAVSRNPAVAKAAEDAALSEAERLRVIKAATEAETAAMRAAERERIAQQAREAVRAQNEQKVAAERASAAAAEADKVMQQEARKRAWLERAAALVGQAPGVIHIAYLDTPYGRRVLINLGADRYTRDHMVDYNCDKSTISTERDLIKRKRELAALCAEFAATYKVGALLFGHELFGAT